jgi:hypothetical protein
MHRSAGLDGDRPRPRLAGSSARAADPPAGDDLPPPRGRPSPALRVAGRPPMPAPLSAAFASGPLLLVVPAGAGVREAALLLLLG